MAVAIKSTEKNEVEIIPTPVLLTVVPTASNTPHYAAATFVAWGATHVAEMDNVPNETECIYGDADRDICIDRYGYWNEDPLKVGCLLGLET